MSLEPKDLLPEIVALADQAGAVIMEHYRGEIDVKTKADASPVTAADEAGEAVILEGLARLAPKIPVIAEEKVAAGDIPEIGDGRFWLVDPLDGTKEFISKNGEFTVNIAL
ncbi:MAG: 3'(2'),5'-bisphosphate nucleotidase CysQ, partial [Alphaproteobacteria bacterium]|nr:3'(2'),5'-bisphosphate nucleotidase CysQ [Alphaproteobacteria bacterium]